MEPINKKEWEKLRDLYILGRLGVEKRELLRRYLGENPEAVGDLQLHMSLRRAVKDLAGREEFAALFAEMSGREAVKAAPVAEEPEGGAMPAPSQSALSAGRLKEIFVEEEGLMSARRRVGKKAEGGAVIRALKPLRGAGWWIPAAAAVILLLVFAVPRLMESLASGGEEPVALFDQYFERPAAEGHLAPTGQGDSLERRWSEAMLAYGNGDCGRFLELSAGLAGQAGFKEGAAAHLYTGACLLGQRQGIEAMAELRQVPAQAIGLYRQAKWYMGLAYLLMQDEESAKEILGEIEGDEANSKQEEAGEILRKL